MKKVSPAKIERRLHSSIAISAVLVLIVVGMLMRIQSLSSQITALENRSATAAAQLNSYQRTQCSNKQVVTQTNQLAKYTIQAAGYSRTYQVHIPNNYDPSVRYPVIISFDGIEGSGRRMESYSGLDALPAIMVYPDSLAGKRGFTAWEGAPYSLDGEQDVEFVSAILGVLPSQYCVDSTRVFAVGMSNGGSFATIVGCELGSQIKAVASVSGAYYTTCKEEQRTPSLLVLHSTDDRQVPFTGTTARRLPKITQWVDEQASQRHCKTKIPAVSTELTTSYSWLDCSDASTLRLTVVHGQSHGWLTIPQASGQRIQGTAGYIWKFFEESTYNT